MGNAEVSKKLLAGYRLAKEHDLPVEAVRDKEIRIIENAYQDFETITNESLIIIDMLLTKLKDPSTETEKASCSIRQVVEEAVSRYPLYKDQKDLVVLDLANDFTFYGNKTMLMHVIFNLLKNALYYIRHVRRGNITISLQRANRGNNNSDNNANPGFNYLLFRDTAKGILPQMIPHIFDRFYSKTEHGTGLGLAFCKLVMKDIAGDIYCNSVYGQFTEFVLQFPHHD